MPCLKLLLDELILCLCLRDPWFCMAFVMNNVGYIVVYRRPEYISFFEMDKDNIDKLIIKKDFFIKSRKEDIREFY